MLLLPKQTKDDGQSTFLSLLCADCRYHFHVKTEKLYSRELDDETHPSHMLIPVCHKSGVDFQDRKTEYLDIMGYAQFICAAEDCFFTVEITVMPPKLTTQQVDMLKDDHRIMNNMRHARAEDPQRYMDVSDTWYSGTTIPTLAQYLDDRLQKPTGGILKVKKRNKRFKVSFGDDFDDLLRSLGFEDAVDDDGEECWYIREPEKSQDDAWIGSRRSHLEDTLEELRALMPQLNTTPAWAKLLDAFPGSLPRRETDLKTAKNILEEDLALLGCLPEFSPKWFSWAAILLARLCPSRRDEFLDAGIRCIQERSEDASMSIIIYKSQFDGMASLDPRVKAAFDFFGASLEDGEDFSRIMKKYDIMIEADSSLPFSAKAYSHLEIIGSYLGTDIPGSGDSSEAKSLMSDAKYVMSDSAACRLLNIETNYPADMIRDFAINAVRKYCSPFPG
jgi:ubiquitin carboxyl-terminal hydrolase 25/28